MPPASAVGILVSMDDQDVIDLLRMTESIAQAEGATSMVSVWLSQLPAQRAAELQRKMVGRPSGLN
jgi:flagellar protein FlbB